MSTSEELRAEARRLVAEANRLDQETLPEPVCSKCGVPEEESDLGVLMEIRVITCPGEEGYSDITMRLCNEDLQGILEVLRNLGFKDHNHGGTALLQDDDCIGGKYNEQHYLNPCPTPTDPYEGTFIVGNYALSPGAVRAHA